MSSTQVHKILIVGGGAGGFFAAIHTKAASPHSDVFIVEAAKAPLAKVKISGGGRCNVTHHCFEPKELVLAYPRGGKELLGPFHRFHPQHLMAWFEQRGVRLKTEDDGRVFPVSDNSETIIQCLLQEAKDLGVKLLYGEKITSIQLHSNKHFVVRFKDQKTQSFDKVLLSTGSSSAGYRMASSFGHTILEPVPSLFTFELANHPIRELSGLSVPETFLRLLLPEKKEFKQTGPLLITHWGLSGPAIIKLSAWAAKELYQANYQALLSVNWIPRESGQSVETSLLHYKRSYPRKFLRSHPLFGLPQRLWNFLLAEEMGAPEDLTWANITRTQLDMLKIVLSRNQYQVTGKGIFKEEFVTCGGVALKEVDFKTMESKICPGLYFAGEILDLDGITGGFNFQSAWTTGWIAGQSMVEG